MRRLWLAGVLGLCGCPKHMTPEELAAYAGTKWEGFIDVTDSCDHGGYTGSDLKICVVFDAPAERLLIANVDWDSNALREDCSYFPFAGYDDGQMHLIRLDAEERDDMLVLERDGDMLTGTFQVHAECTAWPVQMSRVPLSPEGFSPEPTPPPTTEPFMGDPPPDGQPLP